MADGFESRGWNLRLADPSTVSRANIKYADDYTDAAYLVECLRTGSLRTTWVMPKDDRGIRDLARYRMTLVEDRARLKTIIVNMITNHLSIKLTSDKLIREIDKSVETAIESPSEEVAQQVLATYFDHRLVLIKVGSLLNRIRFLATEIGQLDQELLSLLKPNLYSKSLQTIKGCGFVTSMIIALEIGEIERFNTQGFCFLLSSDTYIKAFKRKVQGRRQREERERLLELGFHRIGQPSGTLQSGSQTLLRSPLQSLPSAC